MKLSIKQRIDLLNLLPKSGGKIEMIAISDMYKKLYPSQEEQVEFNFRVDPVTSEGFWENEKEVKEIEFGAVEASVLQEVSKRLDEQKQITMENLPLILEINKL